ncbi:MAG TPA: LpqB family beta-propeller domain-containing protein, partial [Gemmatimonadaceae bacterium]|nr:LpqB family beta-propeller domain-containing protein [Gemmatimonadaceae bacterium]
MIGLATLLLVLQGSAAVGAPAPGVQDAAYASDGRLALAIDGDIWVQRGTDASSGWTRITSGAGWDREPAWSADGSYIVFASNRDGGSHLYRVSLGAVRGAAGYDSATSAPERVSNASDWESSPSVARNGTLAFVRGRGPTARVYLRSADGKERRLTRSKSGSELWPAFSPDGKWVAFVSVAERGRALRIMSTSTDSARTVTGDREIERPSWSPDGARIAFASRRGPAGVWVTSVEGDYVNLVSSRRAAPLWSPDGHTIALVELPPQPPTYNGDPDRLGDRAASNLLKGAGALWFVPAPPLPDSGHAASLALHVNREERNARAFDAAWERTAKLYYSLPADSTRSARWKSLRDTFRPRALAARSDEELASVVHAMLLERPPLRAPATGSAAVSSANPVATEAGLEILRRGGNVVDAAIAVSFALGVVEPDASGIGGYGQMLVRLDSMPRPVLIEFMTRLPQDVLTNEQAILADGGYPDDGPVLPNVPGTVAGMYKAWKEYGSHELPWSALLQPAIRAARDGYLVSDGLATTLATEREHFLKYEGSRKLFFRDGEPLQAGDTLRNPDLAWALTQIADSGANALYRGVVGERMVADLRGHGNAMRTSDLARYYAAEREPVTGSYRGYTIFSSAPPVSGGATLVAQLNMLERLSKLQSYTEDAATLHAMIEAWKLVPPSRGRIADPGLWPVNITAFTSVDSARTRWKCFDPRRALTPDDLQGATPKCAKASSDTTRAGANELRNNSGEGSEPTHRHSTGTTAFTVADADGNVVAVTQTLGTWGGSFYVTPGLGFLYNDKLTSYSSDADAYGARAPYARNGSTIAPTIVFHGTGARSRPLLAVGAAGNAWITSAVYTIVTGILDQKLDVQRAIELPRFLIVRDRAASARDFVIQLEDGFAPHVERDLETLGHRLEFISLPGELRMGYASAIT